MNRVRLHAAIPGFLLAAALVLASSAHAQDRLQSRAGEARVPIYQDDLDQARRRALQQAQEAILRDVLRELLAPEWFTLYEQDLNKRILSRLDRYISAYRVRRLETSLDRTQYFASLEAQVERGQLMNDLHDMALPILGDRHVPIVVLYRADDPVLSVADARAAVLDLFTTRLGLLNLEMQKAFTVPAQAAPLLDNPFANQPARQAWLAATGSNAPAAAYFSFTRSGTAPNAPFVLTLRFYLARDGALLADFSQAGKTAQSGAITGNVARQVLVPDLVTPVANQLQPGSVGNPTAWGNQESRLELRVYGFNSIYDEETFERDFFAQGSVFNKFVLTRLANDSVTYEGVFRGDRNRVERDWTGRSVGAFKVHEVFWNNSTLELFVDRRDQPGVNELLPFPPEGRTPAVTALFDDFLKARPSSGLATEPVYGEAEDNGRFDRANALLFNSPIYGYVDSRADADVYVGEAMRPGDTIEVEWYRLGRTNLTPVLRIFDENGNLTRTVYPSGADAKFNFTIPAPQHKFYLEVTDRFGYLISDAGGYLNYHYLMWVRRDAPDTPTPPPVMAATGPAPLPATQIGGGPAANPAVAPAAPAAPKTVPPAVPAPAIQQPPVPPPAPKAAAAAPPAAPKATPVTPPAPPKATPGAPKPTAPEAKPSKAPAKPVSPAGKPAAPAPKKAPLKSKATVKKPVKKAENQPQKDKADR